MTFSKDDGAILFSQTVRRALMPLQRNNKLDRCSGQCFSKSKIVSVSVHQSLFANSYLQWFGVILHRVLTAVLQITPDMPQPGNSQFRAEAVKAAGHRREALTRAR